MDDTLVLLEIAGLLGAVVAAVAGELANVVVDGLLKNSVPTVAIGDKLPTYVAKVQSKFFFLRKKSYASVLYRTVPTYPNPVGGINYWKRRKTCCESGQN